MRLTVLPIVAPAAAAAVSAALVGLGTWDDARTGLLAALSVIAAAALVRLARGLPFTNPDHLDVDEVEQVTAAVQQLARSLRAFLGIVLATMVLLVLVKPLAGLVSLLWITEGAKDTFQRALSGTIGAALAYVMVRIWQIVGSDLGLLDKQVHFMVRAVHRKARAKEEAEAEAAPMAFKTPEGYGQRLQ